MPHIKFQYAQERVLRIGNSARRHAHRLGECDEVDRGIVHDHADELVRLAEGNQALLQYAIAAVVGDYVGDRQLVMCGGPERLDAGA